MITHIVMIKFKPEHQNDIQDVFKKLMALPHQIDVIRHYEIGLDIIHSERAWDLVIYSKFDSLETLEIYDKHPAHQEAVAFLRPMRSDIASVDYES